MGLEQLLLARYFALGVEPKRPGEAFRFAPLPNVETTFLRALSSGDLSGEEFIFDFFLSPPSSCPVMELSWLAYLD